jgi:hypothetical protein
MSKNLIVVFPSFGPRTQNLFGDVKRQSAPVLQDYSMWTGIGKSERSVPREEQSTCCRIDTVFS